MEQLEQVVQFGAEEVEAVMGSKAELLHQGGVKATAGYGGTEGESVRLGEGHVLKRTHVPGGCELREVEVTANGVGLLWTCAASMWQQACALLFPRRTDAGSRGYSLPQLLLTELIRSGF